MMFSSWVASGELKVTIDSITPLAQAAETHIRLASRGTVGKLLLRPVGLIHPDREVALRIGASSLSRACTAFLWKP